MTTELQQFFRDHPKAAMAFSGGVDSAYLLYTAAACGADIRPYYVKSVFQPAFELEDARRLADQLRLPLTVLELDVLAAPHVAVNPPDRCYYCKRAMFQRISDQARRDGYPLVIDGTNASDIVEERPGLRALREQGVRSPLREAGLSKAEIRGLSNRVGLFTWNKPAYACLATRIAPGEPITSQALERVEAAESALGVLGFEDFRVRVQGRGAKLQLKGHQMEMAVRRREEVVKALSPYFTTIVLDLEGR